MKIIRGKKALITGAASGIGRAIAIALAGEGADLYLIDIDEAGLELTAREVAGRGIEVVTAVCDLREPAQISAAVRALLSRWDHLNILINNAGVLFYGPTHLMSDEEWDRVMSVNLAAPIQLARELLPALLRSQDAHLVNISSIFGLVSSRNIAAYQTSKYGLIGFTEVSCRFLKPVYVADTLYPELEITALIPQRTTGVVVMAARIHNQRAELVLAGEHKYLLRKSAG